MHRVRLSPQDFVRHFAGVQVVIDHELEVGVPTLIGPLAEWLRQRPFSQRGIRPADTGRRRLERERRTVD